MVLEGFYRLRFGGMEVVLSVAILTCIKKNTVVAEYYYFLWYSRQYCCTVGYAMKNGMADREICVVSARHARLGNCRDDSMVADWRSRSSVRDLFL